MNKKIFSAAVAGAMLATVCGVGASAADLNLIVAHNQTSLENPYAYGIIKFKEVVEELSGGAIEVTLHHGTLGENESELIEKLEMGAAACLVNTAIASSKDPAQMAKAFSMAVEGVRIAYNSKFCTVSRDANASSPLTGFLE